MRKVLKSQADVETAISHLRTLNISKHPIAFVCENWGANRTSQQNKYLWAIYKLIADGTGNCATDIHSYCKATFLPTKSVLLGNAEHVVTGSTRSLSTKEMTIYIESIRMWAAEELDISIPAPDNGEWDDFVLRYGM